MDALKKEWAHSLYKRLESTGFIYSHS